MKKKNLLLVGLACVAAVVFAVQVRGAQYQATVGLVRALGGGWGDAS